MRTERNRKNIPTDHSLLTAVLCVLAVALLGLAVLLLGLKIFFVKGGRFPNTHIHDNPEMRKRGITCAKDKEFFE